MVDGLVDFVFKFLLAFNDELSSFLAVCGDGDAYERADGKADSKFFHNIPPNRRFGLEKVCEKIGKIYEGAQKTRRKMRARTKNFSQTIDERILLWYNEIMIGNRIIAFDIGNKRIGVAISDPFNEYAMPCETYFRTRNFDADVEAIAKIAKDRGVGVIVCGMPVNFDGSESIQTVRTREFVEALKEKTDLPVELEDERFTTMQAREVQIAGGVKRADRKKSIDSIAASYILEGYLSRIKNRK